MKKLAILTYTNSNNYGTVLQAYATYKLFCEVFDDYEINVVDSDRKKSEIRRYLSFCKPRGNGINFIRFQNFMKMKAFVKKNICRGAKVYTDSYLQATSDLAKYGADAYVVGSDEMFKEISNSIPCFYYMGETINAYKASYATSANRIDESKIQEKDAEWIVKALEDFNLISVRDSNTEKFIKKYVKDKKVVQLIDPTFCVDFEKPIFSNYLKSIIDKSECKILIMLKNKELAHRVIDANQDCSIYSVYNYHKGSTLLKLSPQEFATCLGEFDCVITDFFHGTCFSIKNNAKFVSVDSERIYATYESKIKNLLDKLGLMDHYLDYTAGIDESSYSKLQSIINECKINDSYGEYIVDYNKYRAETKEFLYKMKAEIEGKDE